MNVNPIQPSIAQDERTQALWKLIEAFTELPYSNALVYDFDRVTDTAIPSLITQLSASEFVVPEMTEAEYRTLLWRSIELHRTKGTPFAVKQSLGVLGISSVVISEWWESIPRRQAHTFRVAIDGEGLPVGDPRFDVGDPAFWAKAYQLIEAAKPARSGFDLAIATRPKLGPARIAASKRGTAIARVNAGIPRPKATIVMATAKRLTARLTVSTPKIPTVVSTQSGLRLGFQGGGRFALDLPVTGIPV